MGACASCGRIFLDSAVLSLLALLTTETSVSLGISTIGSKRRESEKIFNFVSYDLDRCRKTALSEKTESVHTNCVC